MFGKKLILFFIALFFVSVLYAQEGGSLADEAKAKAGKIADVAGELQALSNDAASAGDTKLKVCVDSQLGTVNGLVSSAAGIASQVASLVAAGKTADAQNQMIALNSMADAADQALSKAQSCESGDNQKPVEKNDSKSNKQSNSVSDAMKLDIGSDLVTEVVRVVEGADSADAAGADESDIQKSGNENAGEIAPSAEDPQDVPQPAEEEEDIEEQSPTK